MHPVEMPASNPSGAPLDIRLSTPAGECKTPGHFSGTAGTSPALLYRPLLWPQSGWVPWRHWRKGGGQWLRLGRISQQVARHGKGRTCSFFVMPLHGACRSRTWQAS
jgi:hypothetical protein